MRWEWLSRGFRVAAVVWWFYRWAQEGQALAAAVAIRLRGSLNIPGVVPGTAAPGGGLPPRVTRLIENGVRLTYTCDKCNKDQYISALVAFLRKVAHLPDGQGKEGWAPPA